MFKRLIKLMAYRKLCRLPYACGEVTCPSCLRSFPQKEALQDFDQDNILCPLCFSNWLKLYVSGHIKKFSDLIPPTAYKC